MTQQTRKVVFTALMVALTIVFTLASIALPGGGYYNFGDIAIFISAIVLGPLSGMLTGALGGALGDVILGYFAYAPFTLIIKALEGLIAGLVAKYAVVFCQKIKAKTSLEALFATLGNLLGGLIMAFGYFLAEGLILAEGKWSGGIVNLPWNILQGTISAILSIIFLYVFRLKNVLTRLYQNSAKISSQKTASVSKDNEDNTPTDNINSDEENSNEDKKL